MSYFDPSTGILQGGSGTAPTTQGSAPTMLGGSSGGLAVQGSPATAATLQPANTAPAYNQSLTPSVPAGLTSSSVAAAVDPAAAKAAEDAAKAAELRGQITGLVNSVKDIFNSRYGQVDAAGGEQAGHVTDRFKNESATVVQGVTNENNTAGASFAGRGTRDSSDYGNTVDTITKAGDAQVRDLGTELQDNLAKIAAWVTQQKTGFDAQKGGVDAIMSHLGEQTDPNALATIRNHLDSRIAELKGGAADNNTVAQNAGALETIAPSSARAVQLKTTLASIVGGAADPGQKATIGARLIQSAGLTADEQQKLTMAFQSDLQAATQKDPNAPQV